jgi:hypothetical protein
MIDQQTLLPIGDIKPYWRNPRRIPQEAVDAVAASIDRYGYLQPIVTDTDHVVIVGHTRLQALKQLGWTEVPVVVSTLPAEKAKEYRLVDNRTSELTSWDHDTLVMELREFETALLDQFFPDIDLEIGLVNRAVDEQDVADAEANVKRITEADPNITHTTSVTCPACFHSFEVRTRSLPGVSTQDIDDMIGNDTD